MSTGQKGMVYNVRDFGAAGDGVAWETSALQEAIDACHLKGGGVVWVPPGTYLTAPLQLRSDIRLHLEKGAVILGSPNVDDYADWDCLKLAPYNCKSLIMASGESNIEISGEGVIDGQGGVHYDSNVPEGSWWKTLNKATRPGRMVLFAHCRNVRVTGVTLRDSPAWTLWVVNCDAVQIKGVTIDTAWWAYNTDGIDIDSSRDVHISHCTITSGDDAIVLRAIDRCLEKPRPCEHVVVENCTLASNCNAIRFSYLRDGTIRNVAVRNVTIERSRRGIICQIPIPAEIPEKNTVIPPDFEGPVVENLSFTNISVEARQPLWFHVSDEARVKRIENLTFENMTFTGEMPVVIKGKKERPMRNVIFNNIQWFLKKPHREKLRQDDVLLRASAFCAIDIENMTLSNASISQGEGVLQDDARSLVSLQRCERVTLRNVESRIDGKTLLDVAEGPHPA